MQYPSGELAERVVIVRGHDDRAVLLDKVMEQLEDAVGRFGVQVTGGFVRDDQWRLVQQCAGDGQPLLFASRQFMGHFVAFGAKPNGIEAGLNTTFSGRAFAPTRHAQNEIQIVVCRSIWKQGKILEYDAEVPTQGVYVFAGDGCQVMSTHGALPLRETSFAV